MDSNKYQLSAIREAKNLCKYTLTNQSFQMDFTYIIQRQKLNNPNTSQQKQCYTLRKVKTKKLHTKKRQNTSF